MFPPPPFFDRAPELQFYTSAAAVIMLIPAWIFFMVRLISPLPHPYVTLALPWCVTRSPRAGVSSVSQAILRCSRSEWSGTTLLWSGQPLDWTAEFCSLVQRLALTLPCAASAGRGLTYLPPPLRGPPKRTRQGKVPGDLPLPLSPFPQRNSHVVMCHGWF